MEASMIGLPVSFLALSHVRVVALEMGTCDS